MLCAMPCTFSRLGPVDDNPASFQFVHDIPGAEEDKSVVAGFDFLIDSCLRKPTERNKIAGNRGGSIFLSFSGQNTKEFIQLIATHFGRVGLAFANYPPGLKAMLSLEINLTA